LTDSVLKNNKVHRRGYEMKSGKKRGNKRGEKRAGLVDEVKNREEHS